MKKTLLFNLLCLLTSPAFAQPVITNADLLKVGDIVTTQPCATTTFNAGAAGANQTWDFSQLLAEGAEDTTFYILPAGTPYEASYPSSNIVGKFGADEYGYYQVSGDQLLFWGQRSPGASLTLTDPAVYFKSPTTYGTYLTDSIAGTLTSGALSGTVSGHVFFSGDGYGTLKTPGGEYSDVLRIRTLTVGIATVPFLGTIVDSVYNYSWYKLGIKTPVLEMIEDTQWAGTTPISQVRYVNYFRSIFSPSTGTHTPDDSVIQIFPNPASDQLQVVGLREEARIMLRNAAGQIMLDQTLTPGEQLSVGHLPKGFYLASVRPGDSGVKTIKIILR